VPTFAFAYTPSPKKIASAKGRFRSPWLQRYGVQIIYLLVSVMLVGCYDGSACRRMAKISIPCTAGLRLSRRKISSICFAGARQPDLRFPHGRLLPRQS